MAKFKRVLSDEDYAAAMESIGAGGADGRHLFKRQDHIELARGMVAKPIDQHRKEFEAWAKSRNINIDHREHINYLTQGFYRYALNNVQVVWESWLAARGCDND